MENKKEQMYSVASNKLIAEFMNLDYRVYGSTGTTYYIDGQPYQLWKLRYHSSWDWLMPCVSKMTATLKNPDEDYMKKWDEIYNYTPYSFLSGDIEYVYKVLVKFIKWYNDKNKQL